MSLPVRRSRNVVASLALIVSAFGATGAAASSAPGTEPTITIAGSSAPEAAFKRVGEVRRARLAEARRTPAGTAGDYSFTTVLDGKPVRWNPCAPIKWTANVSRGPSGGLAVLQQAVARVAASTGTSWQYVGSTTTTPTSSYLPSSPQSSYRPVLLGWADSGSSDLLAGQQGDVLGMARTAWFAVEAADGRKTAVTRAGVVALDRTDRLPLHGPNSWYTVALHELGHVMGLDHVNDRTQLMASPLPPATDFQRGDQAGLSRLGRSGGCVAVR